MAYNKQQIVEVFAHISDTQMHLDKDFFIQNCSSVQMYNHIWYKFYVILTRKV